MKFWNKDKRIRQTHWYSVDRKISLGGWNYAETKRQLQLVDSPGKFYLYYAGNKIWFEREQDAMWFALRWS